MKIDFSKIIDISMPISESMPVYGGRPEKKPQVTIQSDFKTGHVYESRIDMNLHTGTHMDAPLHMQPGGETIESLKLENLITPCKVLDLTFVEDKITAADLDNKNINKDDFLLFKTRNSYEDILEGAFVYLDKTAARFLADKKIKGVGIDALGVERAQPEHETHNLLLMQVL